jgi:hypothetical protein
VTSLCHTPVWRTHDHIDVRLNGIIHLYRVRETPRVPDPFRPSPGGRGANDGGGAKRTALVSGTAGRGFRRAALLPSRRHSFRRPVLSPLSPAPTVFTSPRSSARLPNAPSSADRSR